MKIQRTVQVLLACIRGETIEPETAVVALKELRDTTSPAMPPSPRGLEVLRTVNRLTGDNGGMPPTVREIAAELGIKGSTVNSHLDRLEERGLIVRPERGRRGNLLLSPKGLEWTR